MLKAGWSLRTAGRDHTLRGGKPCMALHAEVNGGIAVYIMNISTSFFWVEIAPWTSFPTRCSVKTLISESILAARSEVLPELPDEYYDVYADALHKGGEMQQLWANLPQLQLQYSMTCIKFWWHLSLSYNVLGLRADLGDMGLMGVSILL